MLKKLRKNKGLHQFIIRSGIFAAIVFGIYLFVFLYFRHTQFFLRYLAIAGEFYFPFLTGLRKSDFLNAVLFTGVLFILWNRDTILKLKTYKQDKKQTIIFGILAILSQILHYTFKYWIRTNPQQALQHTLLMTLIKYFFNISFIVLLALAVYNIKFFKDHFNKFGKQIPIFTALIIVYFFLIQFFQGIWKLLSNFVATSLYYMLKLTFDNVYMRPAMETGPRLGVGNFIVGISQECSGIDSLLLFLSLYAALLVLDWKRMNKKRMLILLVPGIIGTIAYNLIRVYLIMLVGILINPKFAIDVFHTNVGWVLFLGFFMLFWHFGSNWVYEKK